MHCFLSNEFQFHCGGMVLEEVPEKMTEAFRLFLQGMGYGESGINILNIGSIVPWPGQHLEGNTCKLLTLFSQ